MVDFRLGPGSSAVISLRLITGNRCATNSDRMGRQNSTSGVRGDSSSHPETAADIGTPGQFVRGELRDELVQFSGFTSLAIRGSASTARAQT